MSLDAVKKFYAKVEADKILKKKLEATGKGALEEVVKLAAAAGFKFTAEDLAEFRQKFASRKLSDAELDMVAGGRGQTACLEDRCGVFGIVK